MTMKPPRYRFQLRESPDARDSLAALCLLGILLLALLFTFQARAATITAEVVPADIEPGKPFVLEFTLAMERPALGFSLFLDVNAPASGWFTIVSRDFAGVPFTETITPDAALAGLVLTTAPAFDLGALEPALVPIAAPMTVLRLVLFADPATPPGGNYAFLLTHGAAVDDLFASDPAPDSQLTVAVVPEPSLTVLLMCGGFALLALRRCRNAARCVVVALAIASLAIGHSSHAADAGPKKLSQQGDVTITNPTSGQVLTYNGTRWINGSAGDYQPAAANLDTWSGIAPTAGVAAWIATPNSTNLLTAMSGFTSGTGSLVFNSSPLITDNAVISILSTKTVETAGSGPHRASCSWRSWRTAPSPQPPSPPPSGSGTTTATMTHLSASSRTMGRRAMCSSRSA